MAELQDYKCPNCDGAVEFNAKEQMIKCPWCGTEFDVALFASDPECEAPDSMEWESASESEWKDEDGAYRFVCNSCGGEIITDETTAATRCPWCDNPVVMSGRVSGEIKPDYVIPFKLDKKEAVEALKKHVSSKKLVPKAFRDENKIEEIRGIYVPFWIYDTETSANIKYRATRTRFWSDSHYNYTETTYYSVVRGGSLAFNKIPIDASTKLENDITESIEPFDFSEAVDFESAYLAGYLADKYDVPSVDCEGRINQRVKRSVEDAFESTVVGYTSVTTEHSSVKLLNPKVKYALFPMWILNTKWQGNTYTFAMNGQTGKFVGDLPLDRGAWWRWLLGVSGIASAIGVGISLLSFFM